MADDVIQQRCANRVVAVCFAWIGGFGASATFWAILLVCAGSYDPLLGSMGEVIVAFAGASAVAAILFCVGSALAVLLPPRIVLRHAKRLYIVTGASAFAAFFIWMGCKWLVNVVRPPYSHVSDLEDILVSIAVAVALSVTITYGVVRVLLHKGFLQQPLQSVCQHCGYPVGTSPLCTECGEPVKPRIVEPVT